MNFLVETKNEYTIQLINILTPHLYEGFESIYSESKKIIKKGEEKKLLKAFQQFIKRIPSWNTNLIDNETIRIKTASRCDFINNLLKAVIKANIILLSNSNNLNSSKEIDKKYLDIPLSRFIHKCYIECARQFYNSPYLFYHEIKPIERKRNQRDANEIIKTSIKEAIRKILPVQHILNEYLGNKMNLGIDQIDKPISHTESENLKQLLSQELDQQKVSEINEISGNESPFKSFVDNNVNLVETHINVDSINIDEKNSDDNDNETMMLLSEMKKNVIDLNLKGSSNENSINDSPKQDNSIPITQYYSENKNSINEELIESEIKANSQSEKIKTIVISKNRNESESSIAYNGKDEEYEDVFSNVLNSESEYSVKNSINRDDIKRKDAYFSRFNKL